MEFQKEQGAMSGDQLCLSSEETFDLFCGPCAEEDKNLEAHGFCLDCREYLCLDCINCHRKVRATRKHTIQDKDSMPKDAEQLLSEQKTQAHQVDLDKDMCTEPCPYHPGKIQEYFCISHDELECSVCVTLKHTTCNMGYIPELSRKPLHLNKYRQLLKKITSLRQKFEQTKDKSTESINDVETKSLAYTVEVTRHEEAVIKHVKTLAQNAIKVKDKFVTEILTGLKASQEQSGSLMEDLNSMQLDLKAKEKSKSQQFVLMKKFQPKVKELEAKLEGAQIDSKSTAFHFAVNYKLTHVKRIKTMGTLYKYKRVVEKCEDIPISTKKDAMTPWITGIEVISDGRLAMVDYNNRSVKLMDVKNKAISETKLEYEPCDLTEVSKGELAITLPKVGRIQFLTTNDKMSLKNWIETEIHCRGLASSQGKLIVGFQGCVRVLNKNGQVVRKIAFYRGESLFTIPAYILFNPDTNLVYVSDKSKQTVTCMTLEGEVKVNYKDESLVDPLALALDKDGSIYVCSMDRIHHLTSEGCHIQVLIDRGQAGAGAQCLAFDKSSDTLFLENSDHLNVYKLQ